MRLRPLVAACFLLGLSACGRDEGPLTPLDYVPADTPYVMGAIDPPPADFSERWLEAAAPAMDLYRDLLNKSIAEFEAKVQAAAPPESEVPVEEGEADEDEAQAVSDAEQEAEQARALLKVLKAFAAELEGRDARQLMDAWGLSLTPRSALYGIDLVPVMRVELAEADKFRAGVERVSSAAGHSLMQSRIGELDYWYFDPPDAEVPLRVIVALQNKQLVATLTPRDADEGVLRRLLGLDLPERSLLEAESLQDLNKRLGFVPYGSGYLDHARIFELLAQPMSPTQSAFLQAMKAQPEPLSEACLDEGRALTRAWPRTVLGYTRFDASGYTMRAVVEAPQTVMADLKTTLAPTPGLLEAASALASFSLAIKVDALPPLASKWAAAVAAQPWTCEALAPMNEAFAQLGQGLQNPAVYAVGPTANSVHVMLSKLELPTDEDGTPEFEGSLLIGSPNPQGLVAMARNFVPQLAEFRLETDAAPVALPTLPDAPVEMPMFGAASAQALGIAFGESAAARLPQQLKVDAGSAQPLIQFSYDGAFYGRMMKQVMERAETDPDAPDMSAMFEFYEQVLGRVDGQLLFTDQGIEFVSSADMP
jgi:hypothetical protein